MAPLPPPCVPCAPGCGGLAGLGVGQERALRPSAPGLDSDEPFSLPRLGRTRRQPKKSRRPLREPGGRASGEGGHPGSQHCSGMDEPSESSADYYEYPNFTAPVFPEREALAHWSPVVWVALPLYALISLLGILGNGAVIFVVGFQMRHTVNTIWFLNLSVADLLCCVALPFLAESLASDYSWKLGGFACKFLPSLIILNMFASVLLLAVISVDRCALVVKPVWCQNHRSKLLAVALCAIAWALAVLLTLPTFLVRRTSHDFSSGKTMCGLNYSLLDEGNPHAAEVSVASMRFLCAFLVPLVVISVCYGLLLCRVRSSRFMRSQKTLAVVLVVIVGFFVCWAPYHVVGMIMASQPPHSHLLEALKAVDPLVVGLAYLNSCMNPVIYVIAGQDFRTKVRLSLHAILRNVLSEEATLATATEQGRGQATCTTEDRSTSTTV
ncbi:C5a anaphylatoxin chemotactic receptor 1 [Heteronotia binoei]|uniref:C5a anaphylatoxin chemotactic receptor 1 n=1 Tax=Heteronotia binoei TaxID=13085 RepID=UPI00292EFBE3|nr:C5a anaphylatoxin chemotactic receptor 1 [Heteronotia binoei]